MSSRQGPAEGSVQGWGWAGVVCPPRVVCKGSAGGVRPDSDGRFAGGTTGIRGC